MAARLKAPYRTARSSAASTSARGYAAASVRTRSAWLLPNRLLASRPSRKRVPAAPNSAKCCGELLAVAVARRGAARGPCDSCAGPRRPRGKSGCRVASTNARSWITSSFSVTRTATVWPDQPPGGRVEVLAVHHEALGVDRAIHHLGGVERLRRQRDQVGPFLGMTVDAAAPWSGGGRARRRPRPATTPWSRSGAPGRGRSGRQASWIRHIQNGRSTFPFVWGRRGRQATGRKP